MKITDEKEREVFAQPISEIGSGWVHIICHERHAEKRFVRDLSLTRDELRKIAEAFPVEVQNG